MVDKLVSSEASEPDQDPLDQENRNRLSLQTATAADTFNGTPRASHSFPNDPPRAPSMEREETIRPVFPSIWNTPFAPLPGEANTSPRTRPSTARRLDPNTPVGLSSSGLFRQDIIRQQNLLDLQSSPYQSPEIASSWAEQPTSYEREGNVLATTMRFQGSGLLSSSDQSLNTSDEFGPMIRDGQKGKGARFGIIGEAPPSGQNG